MASAINRTKPLQEAQQFADKSRRDFINNLLDLDLAQMRGQVQVCVEMLENPDNSDEARENAKRILDFVNALGRFRFPLLWED